MNIIYDDIVLRAVEEEDLEMLQEMMNDPSIEKMVGGSSNPISMQQQKRWFENLPNRSDELRLIIDAEGYGAIGTITITSIDWRNRTGELNIKILNRSELRGKGYGTKANIGMIKYGFEQLNLYCIYGYYLDYNKISDNSREKFGFKTDGVLKNRIFKDNKYHDLVAWSLSRDDFDEEGMK